ncbi:bolA-like protein 3 isoform X1 [Mustela nigripes]|uniref:bolA-like protein 3 isoform X1 n=1 Tax=Mustela nigripes TaxID=77151 RepID=UPI00281539BA|nr:bolA-like protein 3 isoform X1 [Mustela nigripes]
MAAWSPAVVAPLLRGIRGLPLHCARRMFASQTEGELKVTQILKEKFPGATAIKVTDISGELEQTSEGFYPFENNFLNFLTRSRAQKGQRTCPGPPREEVAELEPAPGHRGTQADSVLSPCAGEVSSAPTGQEDRTFVQSHVWNSSAGTVRWAFTYIFDILHCHEGSLLL